MTTQTRSHAGAMRPLLIVAVLCLGALIATVSLLPTADAAKPHLVRDECSETSGDSQGHQCNSANDLLIHTKNADGTCGDWICCPPNGNGTYDCVHGSSAGLSAYRDRVKKNRATTTTTVSPGTTTTSPKAPAAKSKARSPN